MSELLYGSGLRLMECARLRVKDIDFGYGHITVRDGKGLRERVTILPERLRRPLQLHLSSKSKSFTCATSRRAAVEFTWRLPCDANIRMLRVRGHGNMSYREQKFRPTLAQTKFAATISARKIFRTP